MRPVERYEMLSERIELRYANRRDFQISAERRYPELSEFEELQVLGRIIVPLVFQELIEGKDGFRVQLLEAIIGREVNLAHYSGVQYYGGYKEHKRLWLKWWSEVGCHQTW